MLKTKYYLFFGLLLYAFLCKSQNIIDSIPFNYEYGFIVVKGKVNDKTYDFLFDTGGLTSITDKVIKELSLEPIFQNRKMSKYSLKVALSNNILSDKITVINRRRNLAPIADGGVVGRDFFNHRIFKIDYKKKRIYFFNKLPNNQKKNALHFYWEYMVPPYATMTIGDVKAKVCLDTGYSSRSGLGLAVCRDIFDKLNIDSLYHFKMFSLLKNDTIDKTCFKANFQISELKIDNYKMFIRENSRLNIVGNYFFQDYTITFDFKNNKFYFE